MSQTRALGSSYPQPSDLGQLSDPSVLSAPRRPISPSSRAQGFSRRRARAEREREGGEGGRRHGAAAHVPEEAQLRHQVQPDQGRQDPR